MILIINVDVCAKVHTIGSWNPVLMAKDVQAVRLMRCNVYRLSHHPHDEQLLEMADQMGIVVIQHVPASYFVCAILFFLAYGFTANVQ